MHSAQKSDLAPIFGDLSQSEKLSEIKPPLVPEVATLGLQLKELFLTHSALKS